MTQAVQATKPEQSSAFTPDEIKILKDVIMPGATDSELSLFSKVCAQTGLSPFARQIFPVSRMVWNAERQENEKRWTFQTSVDGFRLVAQRSKEYEGQTVVQWCGEDGAWKDHWLVNDFPKAARVGVYRKNFREPLYAIAVWESYVQKYVDKKTKQEVVGNMWRKMPELMLAKCAECLALRKAFPQELSGVYSQEEMDQDQVDPPKQQDPFVEQQAALMDDGVYRFPFGATFGSGPALIQLKGLELGRIHEKIKTDGIEDLILKFNGILSGSIKSPMILTELRKRELVDFISNAEAFLDSINVPQFDEAQEHSIHE